MVVECNHLNENVAPGRVDLSPTKKNITIDLWTLAPGSLMEGVHDKKVSARSEHVQP